MTNQAEYVPVHKARQRAASHTRIQVARVSTQHQGTNHVVARIGGATGRAVKNIILADGMECNPNDYILVVRPENTDHWIAIAKVQLFEGFGLSF